jgi:hypothetical protein
MSTAPAGQRAMLSQFDDWGYTARGTRWKNIVPIHVLVIHIQPGDTVFLPLDHVAKYYRAVGVYVFEACEAFERRRRVKTAGSGRDFSE